MHFQFAQYLDLARCNRSASRHERNRTSLSVILTYRRCIWPFAHGAQQRCPRSRGQNNTISARMECTRHTVSFRKYRWAAEHPSFYALTSLFPSISRYKRSHTRGRQFERRPYFLAHSRSLRQMTDSLGSSTLIMIALTRIYTPSLLLCLFILAHCLDPHHGDNKTDIDQSVLACSHTFNVHSSTPHSPSRCYHVTPAPPSTLLLATSATPYFLGASDH